MNYRSLNDVGPVVFLRQFNKYKMKPRANSKNKFGRKFGVRKNLTTFLKNQNQALMNWVELIEPWSLFSSLWRKWAHSDNTSGILMIHERVYFLKKLIMNGFHSPLDSKKHNPFQWFTYSVGRALMDIGEEI